MATRTASKAAKAAGSAAKNTGEGAAKTAGDTAKQAGSALTPSELLKQAMGQLATTMAERAASSVTDRVSATAERLNHYAESGGSGGLKAALTGASKLAEGKSPASAAMSAGFSRVKDKVKDAVGGLTPGGGGGGTGDKVKVTNIVESIDVGVPIDLAYNQWTRFTDYPRFMKKVERVEQVSDEKLEWKAQIFLSHRTWESTIEEQVPNERIVWRSKGEKGYVDGAVTFHELGPQLTRIVLVLEYHPQGFFEKTGNLWRAQGRRARLELKHFQRHVMAHALLHPEEVEGWRGEIRQGEVVDEQSEEESEEEPEEESAEDENAEDENAENPPEERTTEGNDREESRPRRRRTASGNTTRKTRGGRS
ncbi:SRPBCC family protein [Prauserella sp. PE36]|uniref:SRPBCC family protein n=1 Tax=Prauserella sp. PE36 TaxID=1504709 RepID=UPI001F273875|nr:SRPBCC family protein [Prauserella sp. PE36]